MFLDWFWEYGIVILFYLGVIALIYFNRSKFQFENKIIAMYRTKIGLKLMDKFSKKLSKKKDKFGAYVYKISLAVCLISGLPLFIDMILVIMSIFETSLLPQTWALIMMLMFWVSFAVYICSIIFLRQIKLAGTTGIHAGFVGMVFMVLFMGLALYLMVFRPDLPALFSPVLPGIQIPGSPVKLPLIEGLLALFVVVVVHEFSHGVVCRAYDFKIKSSGFVMMGPLPGAFVEPDEKQLNKAPSKAQLSMFAAGPFSNILLFFLILGIYLLGSAGLSGIYESTGITVAGFVNEADSLQGARLSEINEGDVIVKIDDTDVASVYDVRDALSEKKPGDEVDLIDENGVLTTITLTSDPNDESKSIPYLGLMLDSRIETKPGLNKEVFMFLKAPFLWILKVLYWIWVLSLGIGIVNLLPIGPTDGGRMYLQSLKHFMKEKKAMIIWANTAKILLFILAILIVVPILKAVMGL